MLRAAAAVGALASGCLAHNSLMIPTSRNAMDGGVFTYDCTPLSPTMSPGWCITPRSDSPRLLPAGVTGEHCPLTCTCADSQPCDMGEARKEGGAGQPCL